MDRGPAGTAGRPPSPSSTLRSHDDDGAGRAHSPHGRTARLGSGYIPHRTLGRPETKGREDTPGRQRPPEGTSRATVPDERAWPIRYCVALLWQSEADILFTPNKLSLHLNSKRPARDVLDFICNQNHRTGARFGYQNDRPQTARHRPRTTYPSYRALSQGQGKRKARALLPPKTGRYAFEHT